MNTVEKMTKKETLEMIIDLLNTAYDLGEEKVEMAVEFCEKEIAALDRKADIKYRNPNLLYEYIIERTKDADRKFYVLVDEIQLSYKVKSDDIDESLVPEEDREMMYTTFYDILNDFAGTDETAN